MNAELQPRVVEVKPRSAREETFGVLAVAVAIILVSGLVIALKSVRTRRPPQRFIQG